MALNARTNGPVTDCPQAPHGMPPLPAAVAWLLDDDGGPYCELCESAEDESTADDLLAYG